MTRVSLRLDVEEWTQKLNSVWKPTRILDISNRGTLGLLFIARLEQGLTLHLRVQWTGVDTCTLWRGQHYVMWDNVTGFRVPSQPLPETPEQEGWETQMRTLIRRNCFLMGRDVEATEEEKRQWMAEQQGETPETSEEVNPRDDRLNTEGTEESESHRES